MNEHKPLVAGAGAGVASVMGLSAQGVDLGVDAVPDGGVDVVIVGVGAIQPIVKAHLPKGSILLFVDPATAEMLRAQFKPGPQQPPEAVPGPQLRVVR